ncbi:MAG TPA: amidinotransferase [Bacteroidetes bacterium]|nr:amidinotransferase [Bacteroidota bacterium]
MPGTILQTTSNILMVRPANFGFNEETAASNAFQSKNEKLKSSEISQKAIAEFDALVEKLRAAGVHIIVVEDTPVPVKPDAVFPNNWITFHQNGTVITYPMLSEKRRLERREDIIDLLVADFHISKKIELEDYEKDGLILEGTGSLILDRPNRLAYACLSPRTAPRLLSRFCEIADYEPVAFHSVDGQGLEIYHTNVMMAMGETFVVICLETIKNEKELALLKEKFAATNKEIIEISLGQMMHFAGNMLQVRNAKGKTFLVMSSQAHASLHPPQIQQIEKHTQILHSPIPVIEQHGGGSVRCMMAEVFLPLR